MLMTSLCEVHASSEWGGMFTIERSCGSRSRRIWSHGTAEAPLRGIAADRTLQSSWSRGASS